MNKRISTVILTLIVFAISTNSILTTIASNNNVYGIHEEVPGRGYDPNIPQGEVARCFPDEKFSIPIGLPCPGKFVVYGDNPRVNTEIKGTVFHIDESLQIIIAVDESYQNLLIDGNYLGPVNTGIENQFGLETYNRDVRDPCNKHLPGKCSGAIPVIKIECTSAPPNVATTCNGSDSCMDDGNGGIMPIPDGNETDCVVPHYKADDPIRKIPGRDKGIIKQGDHIKVTGLFVMELQHPYLYSDPCQPPFLTQESIPGPLGLPRTVDTCYGHAELHPYNYETIESVSPLKPTDVNTETHTVVAPIYDKVITCGVHKFNLECFQNPLFGRLIDRTERTTVIDTFLIAAPPEPSECSVSHCELRFQESNVIRTGEGFSQSSYKGVPGGWEVRVQASGESVTNPAVFQATYKVWWDTSTPNTIISLAIDGNGKSIGNGEETMSDSMRLDFTATQSPSQVSFECNINFKGWKPCSSPYTVNIENGLERNKLNFFDVRAKTAEGNTDPTPARWEWTMGNAPRDPCTMERNPNCLDNTGT